MGAQGMMRTVAWTELVLALRKDGVLVSDKAGPATAAWIRSVVAQAPNPAPAFTTGHCENHKLPGGCPLHNLHCGWPNCDRAPATCDRAPTTGQTP